MRITGYILLIAGVLLILFEAVGNSERKAILLGRYSTAIEQSGLPSEHPVAQVCLEMIRGQTSHLLETAGIIMLAGGICLDFARRRKDSLAKP